MWAEIWWWYYFLKLQWIPYKMCAIKTYLNVLPSPSKKKTVQFHAIIISLNFFAYHNSTSPAEKIHWQNYLWEILRTMYFNQTPTNHNRFRNDCWRSLSWVNLLIFLQIVYAWMCVCVLDNNDHHQLELNGMLIDVVYFVFFYHLSIYWSDNHTKID